MGDTTFLLRGRGDVSQAVNELRRLGQEWAAIGQVLRQNKGAAGLDGLREQWHDIGLQLQGYRKDAGGATSGTNGLTNSLSSLRGIIAAVGAAIGAAKILAWLKGLVAGAVEAAASMQNLRIAFETLQARELVRFGEFETIGEALGEASSRAEVLLGWLRNLALVSPFEYEKVADTFRLMQAFGATTEMAQGLTSAILDVGAGLGLTGAQMERLSYNFGQVISQGKITARDMRDLRLIGLDLADVFSRTLGKSIEQVNDALANGSLTMKDVSEAFMQYATENYGGAAERMSKTFQGLKSSIKDLFFFVAADSLTPLLDKVTAALSVLFDKARALLESGFFEKLGEFLASPMGMGLVAAIAGVTALAAGFVALLGTISGLMVAWPVISGLMASVAPIIAPLLVVVAALAAVMAGLVATGMVLATAWREDWGGIRTAIEEAWASIKPKLSELVALVRSWGAELGRQAAQIWSLVKGYLIPIFQALASFVRSIDWDSHLGTLKDALNVVLGYVSAWLETLRRLLSGEGLRAFSSLREAAINGLTLVALVFDKYVKRAAAWGWNLIVNFANGLMRAAQAVLTKVMQAIGNVIGRFLAPGSPPKEGPLSQIVKWGKGLIDTFLRAFGLADFGLLRDALSPIKDALEQAVSAGDLDTTGFLQLFSKVRTQVAALIADFRKTGVISEEALGQIGAALGPGSEDLVEFLRLQLQYQKSLEGLADVQDEVTAAEAKGFVPKALKDKLAAAKAEADAAKDKMDWQREYLDMQQESVDLQLRLIEALEGLGDSLAGAAGGAGGAMGGAGAGALDLDVGGLGDLDMGGLVEPLGVMSDEFAEMRLKVLQALEVARWFLALPWGLKLAVISAKFQEITGIDLSGGLQGIRQAIYDWIEGVGIDIGEKLLGIRQSFYDWIEGVGIDIGTKIVGIRQAIWDWIEGVGTDIGTKILAIRQAVYDWIEGVGVDIATRLLGIKTDWETRWTEIKTNAETIWREIVTAITDKAKEIWKAITTKVEEIRIDLDTKWGEIKTALGTAWAEIVTAAIEKALEIYNEVTGKIQEIKDWIDGYVSVFRTAGGNLVDALKAGIAAKWEAFMTFLREKLQAMSNLLPFSEPKDPRSPLRGLGKAGEAMVANMARGIDFSPIRDALNLELGQARMALSGASIGDINVTQQFLGDMFPGVTSGRTALDVDEVLKRRALQGVMAARA